MKTYEVQVVLTYVGCVSVAAQNEETAKELAKDATPDDMDYWDQFTDVNDCAETELVEGDYDPTKPGIITRLIREQETIFKVDPDEEEA